jgi:hypothetical protein
MRIALPALALAVVLEGVRGRPAGSEITRGVPGSASIDAGAPYLDAFSLTGEDLVEGTLRESD